MLANVDPMWAALLWGALSASGLLIGAAAGTFFRLPHRAIAMTMSVGAGLLLAGVSFKVAAEATQLAGSVTASLSLLLGAAVFSASNALLNQLGAGNRKRCGECLQQANESQKPGSGGAIVLGNALDGMPEALLLGIALRDPIVPTALVVAFAVGNFPEALSSAAGMREAGRSRLYVCVTWSAVATGSALAVAAGFAGLAALDSVWPPRLQAFGAGALLAMIAETMIPEAFHDSPRFSGLLAAVGFGFLLLVDGAHR
jgi:zinc transporter, ZIP family